MITYSDASNSDAKIEELDKIPSHVRSIKELLSNNEKLEYYLANNIEEVIYILTNYELLEESTTTLHSSDSLFSYENVGSTKLRAFSTNKNIINDVDYTHTANNVEI